MWCGFEKLTYEKDHKIKVLKQIVGKYLEFEKKTGTKEDQEKAAKYVQELMKSKMNKMEEDDENSGSEE